MDCQFELGLDLILTGLEARLQPRLSSVELGQWWTKDPLTAAANSLSLCAKTRLFGS